MRRFTLPACVLSLIVFGPSAQADDTAAAKEILTKAYAALGGEKVDKPWAGTWSEEGTYYGMGEGVPFVSKVAIDGDARFRMEIYGVFTSILNGDQGWMIAGGAVTPMTKEQVAEQKKMVRGMNLGRIGPLLKEKGFEFKLLGEEKVDDRPAVGVKVSQAGYDDLSMYFDKETHLPVKIAHRAADESGKQVEQADQMRDYRDLGGRKVAHGYTVYRAGKKFVEGKLKEFNLTDKVDEKLFQKPE